MSQIDIVAPYRSLKILMVEDVPEDAELTRFHLEKAGYILKTKVVDDEADFTQALKHFCPDIILSDYALPTFSGLQALLIARDMSPTTPFIFVTGAVGEEIASETIISGASGFVLKSNLSRLSKILNDIFEEQEGWYSQRLARTNQRIRDRIDANLEALGRIHKFLDSRKNDDPEWTDTMHELEVIKLDLLKRGDTSDEDE